MEALLSDLARHPGSRIKRRRGMPCAVEAVDRLGRCCVSPSVHWATVAGLLTRGFLRERDGIIRRANNRGRKKYAEAAAAWHRQWLEFLSEINWKLDGLKVVPQVTSPGYVELAFRDDAGATVLLIVGPPAEIIAAVDAGEPLDDFLRLPHRTASEVLGLVIP